MTDLVQFKRLNFFTGFFTTATDWNEGEKYHLEKRKLHNRRLHTPGIMRSERDELRVETAGGLDVRVLPGVALDGAGNEIYLGQERILTINPNDFTLPQLIYIVIKYEEKLGDYVDNVEAPQYSGHTRWAEIPRVAVSTSQPNITTWLELARIDLQPGVTEITNPQDPGNPAGNEIDRRYVVWAGSVGLAGQEPRLSPEQQERLILLMRDGRRDFAALVGRFPVPSVSDVRHAAVTVELLARSGSLLLQQLPDVLATIAAIEQDVGQEIGETYPPAVTGSVEYQAYQDAVATLLAAIGRRENLDTLFTRQGEVTEAARELSQIVLQSPVADAGSDRTIVSGGEETTVTLDASGSRAFGGWELVRYRWEKKQ